MKKEFSKEYEFIRNFNKIRPSKIMKDLNISEGNFYQARVSNEKEILIKNRIIHDMLLLLIKEFEINE